MNLFLGQPKESVTANRSLGATPGSRYGESLSGGNPRSPLLRIALWVPPKEVVTGNRSLGGGHPRTVGIEGGEGREAVEGCDRGKWAG